MKHRRHQAEPAQPAAGQAEDPDNLTDEEFARRLQHEEQMENWRQMYAAQGLGGCSHDFAIYMATAHGSGHSMVIYTEASMHFTPIVWSPPCLSEDLGAVSVT